MDNTQKSKLKKMIYISLIATVFLVYAAYECREIKRGNQLKQTLNQLHQSLQNYHVKYEAYVPGPKLKAAKLIFHLHKTGFMEEIPINPYTGKPFMQDDPNDRITYETDDLLETFKLKAKHFDNDEIIERMESNGLGRLKEDP